MANESVRRRGWISSLIIAACAAIVLGLPTGLALVVLLESRATTLWFVVFPLAVGAAVFMALRYWPARDSGSFNGKGFWLRSAALAAIVLAADAAVVFGLIGGGSDCTWEESDEVAASTELAPGLSIGGDGNGLYVDGADGVDTFIKHSLKLAMFEPQLRPPRDTARRFSVDLSQPVPGSGAAPLGVLSTGRSMKAFWYQTPSHMVRTVHAIPAGDSVPSDRTDVVLEIDGREHYLTMGKWSGPYCENLGINGAGTSDVTITRSGPEEFLVTAPPGSVARLWDVSGRTPVDKGLYQVSLRAHFKGQTATSGAAGSR